MPESAIGAEQEQATERVPFPELAGPLDALKRECAGLADDAARVHAETGATLDALMAETERQFDRLRQAHAVIRDLDSEQAAKVLHAIRDKARRRVGFQAPGGEG